MGLTKHYNRFMELGQSFGLIGAANSCIRFVKLGNCENKYLATSCCQYISFWDSKTHQLLFTLESSKSEITYFDINYVHDTLIAIGHLDGSIDLFNYQTRELKVSFNGHKSKVTCICFDEKELRLASGGNDTNIIVWDIVNQSGLFKLKGHKNVITKCQFMKNNNVLVSSSKDGTIKFWDLLAQHCFKTFLAHKNEVLDFILYDNDSRCVQLSIYFIKKLFYFFLMFLD